MRRELALVGVLGACAGPRFLGEPVGKHCPDEQTCRIWAGSVLDRTSVGLFYDDRGLRAYVAGVADRLIRANHLALTPRIEITSTGVASAEPDGAIYIRRDALAGLSSEAALAGVLAHELVHLEAGTTRWLEPLTSGADQLAWSRAIESIADERAVGFVVAAGYDPRAMLDMLAAVDRILPGDDHTHPSELQRETRVAALIAGRAGGELGRERYRAHVDGILLGDDPRFATVIGDAVVSLAIGIAVVAGPETIHAKLMTTPRADRIADALLDRRERIAAGHRVVIGVARSRVERVDASRQTATAEALARVTSTLAVPEPGAHVVMVRGEHLDLWLELTGKDIDDRAAKLVARLRPPTATERARLRPLRLHYRAAKTSGPFEEVAKLTCTGTIDLRLDDRHRAVTAGEPIACSELDR